MKLVKIFNVRLQNVILPILKLEAIPQAETSHVWGNYILENGDTYAIATGETLQVIIK